MDETLRQQAEDILSYWGQHGDNPETVTKWAMQDLLGLANRVIQEVPQP
jgi:hypothetical protein